MKKAIYLLLPFAVYACGADEAEETGTIDTAGDNVEVAEEKQRKSPRINEAWSDNEIDITFDYGSPRVKERVIWGDLVPYDKIWRAGADEATAITFNQDVSIMGSAIASGTYGFYLIPKEEGDWTVILNEEWSKEDHDVWGAYDYKEGRDVLRFDVTPDWNEESAEELSYAFKGGLVIFKWEKAEIVFEVVAQEPA